jgi:hypothetical protein
MKRGRYDFQYLGDPICIASLCIYVVNRFWLKPNHIGGWFTHGYLNDCLCLPLFVPIILWIQHLVGLRRHARFPNGWEIFQNLAVFTFVFQVVIPQFPKAFTAAGDRRDIIAYATGGLIAGMWWRSRVRQIANLNTTSDRICENNLETGVTQL